MIFSSKCRIKVYKVMIDGKKILDQTVKNNIRTYKNIQKVVISQGIDYTLGCLLDYPYFKENYKVIDRDLSKQQALDANPNAIQQISFNGNLEQGENIFSFLEK